MRSSFLITAISCAIISGCASADSRVLRQGPPDQIVLRGGYVCQAFDFQIRERPTHWCAIHKNSPPPVPVTTKEQRAAFIAAELGRTCSHVDVLSDEPALTQGEPPHEIWLLGVNCGQ